MVLQERGDQDRDAPPDRLPGQGRDDASARLAAAWYGDEAAPVGEAARQGVPSPIKETLGERYLVEREIGAGAFSITYRGRDERLGRTVAIKVLRPHYALDPTYVQRFEREARTAASVSQGNVVDVYDFGRHGELLYIVMQYVEGMDLKQLIVRQGPLAPRRAVEITRQILAGLAVIHHAGIIHRDIKPQNVLIGDDGIARVTDFGVAHVTVDIGLTTAGTTVGTASYMAPEQAQAGELTEATDLYAVGVVLYEMLSGRLPFEAPTAIALMLAHIREQPLPPSARAPNQPIPPALDGVVMQALAKPPDHRFPDAAAMARAVSAALQRTPAAHAPTQALAAAPTRLLPSGAPPPAREAPPPPAAGRRRLLPAAVLALLLVGGAAAGAARILGDDDAEPPGNLPAVVDSTSSEPAETATAAGLTETETVASAPTATSPPPTETPEPTPTETSPPPTDTPEPTETLPPTPTDTPAPTPTDPPPTPTVEPAETSTVIEPITGGQPEELDAATDTMSADGVQGDQESESDSRAREAVETGEAQTFRGEIGAQDWNGAYYRGVGNLQPWAGLYSQQTEYHTGTILFDLPGEPAAETFELTVEGMTSENFADIPLAVAVNGVEVARLDSPFPTWNGVDGDQPWATETLSVPSEELRAGRNELSIINLIEQGEFGLPPYVLLADATLSVDVTTASEAERQGVADTIQPATEGQGDVSAIQPMSVDADDETEDEDSSGQNRGRGRGRGGDDDEDDD